MFLVSFLKRGLESEFAFGFDIKELDGNNHLKISIQGSEESLFDVTILIKNDIRLKINVTPQLNGGYFMRLLSESTKDKRTKFCEYWEILGINRTTLKLNEIPSVIDDFINFEGYKSKFSFDFSLLPYCEEEADDKTKSEIVLEYTILVFKMMLSLLSYDILGYEEGRSYYQLSKKYERNPANRFLCLKLKGCKCSVCGFDFYDYYGEVGKGYIEVHHSLPVSLMEQNHVVIPEKELFPLCANCHRIIHRKSPPYTIDELKKILKEKRSDKP